MKKYVYQAAIIPYIIPKDMNVLLLVILKNLLMVGHAEIFVLLKKDILWKYILMGKQILNRKNAYINVPKIILSLR